MSYFNYGRGYRNAGFNAQATPLFDSDYKSETTNNFELGLKTTSVNQRMIFNTSVFYIDFNRQQQYGVGFGSKGLLLGNYNYSKSRSSGFEADWKYRTSKYLDVLISYGLTRSKIIDGGKAGTTDRTAFNGNYVPFTPLSSFSAGLQSNFALSKTTAFTGIINCHYKGKIYWHEDNKDISKGYSLVDARLGLLFNKKFELAVWGANLLNIKYYQEYYAAEVSGSATGDIAWKGKQVSYGLEIGLRF